MHSLRVLDVDCERCARPVPVAGERMLELKGIAEPVTAVLVDWSAAAES